MFEVVKKYITAHLEIKEKEIKGIKSLLELDDTIRSPNALETEAKRIFNTSERYKELRKKIATALKHYEKLKPKEPPPPSGTIKDKGRGR